MADTKTTTKKKRILYDVTVEADLSQMTFMYHNSTEEDRAKALECAVKEFHDFLRDHRSQDMVQLDVMRNYRDICTNCKNIWDSDFVDKKTICANCGAELEE